MFRCMQNRCAPFLWLGALLGGAGTALGHDLAVMEVVATPDHAVGRSESASHGVVAGARLDERAWGRPADVLEHIPGMVVTQHSGEGKANQYFLRGMNLDHGTDFATTLNGVPLNMPSHAHGQGYTDLNLLIPELVARMDYRKGPYQAADGDFASAGSVRISYRKRLPQPLLQWTVGEHGHRRTLVAGSHDLSDDRTLLMALEQQRHDGPWTVPEDLRRSNALLTLSAGTAREGWHTSLSSYSGRWTATDQVPQRLIASGVHQGRAFGRFDSLDPSAGGDTRLSSLTAHWHRSAGQALTRVDVYALRYTLNLYSNFTYSLMRPQDQFAQTDQRSAWGLHASHTWRSPDDAQRPVQNTLGLSWRQDRIRAGLHDSEARQWQASVRDDAVRQQSLGVYAENQIGWTPWLRTVAGLRADQLDARVHSLLQPQNSGTARGLRASPKFSLVLGPWAHTEWFVHVGRGFHSNDARGTTARIDPRSGEAIDAVPVLVGTRGRELGLRSQLGPTLQTTLALWELEIDSELVYAGDAGNTEAGRRSRRTGLEWRQAWSPGERFWLDLSLAWTRPRHTDGAPEGPYIPNAQQRVGQWTMGWRLARGGSGSLTLRHLGAAPLREDGAVRSAPTHTLNLRLRQPLAPGLEVALDVLNLTDRRQQDISYHYVSRLPGESAQGVPDVHLHPALPRTARLSLRMRL